MKNFSFRWLCMVLVSISISAGCVSSRVDEKVTYLDRNKDGKVDLEQHHYHNLADGDWQLSDDDYDGYYEKKVLFGVGVFESKVNLNVPTNVRINKAR